MGSGCPIGEFWSFVMEASVDQFTIEGTESSTSSSIAERILLMVRSLYSGT